MGKISKSKKTLALVMALVMAFTIVPFGAWGVIKASAESPNPNAVNFQLATELRDGQAYVIVDRNGQYMMTDNSKNSPSEGVTAKVNYQTFNVGMSIADVIAQGGLWEYDLTTESAGDDNSRTHVERFKRTSLLDERTQVWLDLYGNGEVHTYNTDGCQLGISKNANGYWYINRPNGGHVNNGTVGYLGFTVPDNIGYDNFCQQIDPNCQGVLIYEPIDTTAENIDLPITLRDLKQDGMMMNPNSCPDVDRARERMSDIYGFLADKKDVYANNGDDIGHVNTNFLRLAGEGPNANNDEYYDFRKGLTDKNFQNGEMRYSPYTVIYIAHAIRENLSCWNNNCRQKGNYYLFNESDPNSLAYILLHKYMKYEDDSSWDGPHSYYGYTEKRTYQDNWDKKSVGSQLENELNYDNITSFYKTVWGNTTLKNSVDAYFDNCYKAADKGGYADYTTALAAAKAIIGDNTSAVTMASFWTTVNRADSITWDNIKSENPRYETTAEAGDLYSTYDWKAVTPYTPKAWRTLTYTDRGASIMDCAYYLLNHFFDSENGAEGNYNKTVTDKAHTLRLEKVMHADGTIAYVYDSSYKTASDFNKDGRIENTGLTKNDSTGVYKTKANFTPINGKGFETDANAQNYGLTLHGNGKFVYSSADNLYFNFNGDDDVFLYINGKRVDDIDIGGIHGPQSARVNLNDAAVKNTLGLEEGKIYDFDFYYMERCPVGSNLRMETNIVVTDAPVLAQKKGYKTDDYVNGAEYEDGTTVIEGTPVYYELAVNNLDVTGNSTIDNIVLEDEALGIKLSANQNDIKLAEGNSKVDLSQMVLGYAEVDAQGKPIANTERKPVGNDKAAIAEFFKTYGTQAKMKAGTSIWADNIKYTMDRDTLASSNGVFTNTMKATADVHPQSGTGNVQKKTGTDSFTMKLFNIVNKTFVTDFVSGNQGIVYKGEDVFTGADEIAETSKIGQNVSSLPNGSSLTYDPATKNITYYPSDLKGADTFTFNVFLANGDTDVKKVTFVPGNNIYYDDSFTGDHGIKYTGDWKTTTGAAGAISGVGGTDVIYGNNPNFGSEVEYSGKTIHSIVGNGSKVTASLDFSGQGATVYMKTTANSGSMVAQLFKKGEDKPVRTLMVNLTGTETLNSVPAVNFLDLPYGDYEIRLTINAKAGTETYLDGIRVYLPLGSDNAYYNPSEHNAQFIEIRDNVVNVAEIDKLVDEAILGGALYIDGTSGVATLADYTKEGPKNEIYLAQNQGITFKIDGYQEGKMFVQVGARMLKGTAGKLSFDNDTNTGTDITSATDMFYKVTVSPEGLVTITNTGAGVVALTNLKVTGAMAPRAKMVVSRAIADEAIEYLNTAPVAPEVPETPTEPETPVVPQNPFEKFFNDIRDFFNKLFGIK